uniref:Sema domain-containing protein n=1 Tax=Esox lucius TaxID=8010 RepID=A0A3P8ZWQ5_ESOLU
MKYIIFLATFFSMIFAEKSPRLKFIVNEPAMYHFSKPQNYMSVYHHEGTNVLYVGGQAVIYVLTFTDRGVSSLEIPVVTDENAKATCIAKSAPPKLECDNFITVIQKVNDTFVVCGTNAGTPKCWLLVNDTVLIDAPTNGQMASASDISPPYPSQRSVSVFADGNLYSAVSAVGRNPGTIRRTYGTQKLLKTESKWLQSPQFGGAAVMPSSQKLKDEIYFFFSEINKTARVDEEPYRSRIGRVCMVDEGGIKNLLPDSWTTFMKARVMCGVGSTPQQYNNIRQAIVLSEVAQEKRTGVMYGLFANAWDTTVICAYSVEDIDQAFATSKLKGYSSPLIGHRPGTCAFKNSTAAQNPKTLGVIRDHPEIEDVIRPVGGAPLNLPTDDHFTHTVAAIVLAVNDEHYSVLYLGTEQGKVLKVLHTNEEVFIICQYSLFHNDGPVLSMAIDSKQGHLYVGTAMAIQRIPLADCGRYGNSCQECILSRDPYCGWDAARRRCTAIPSHRTNPKRVVIDSNSTVYLPCPLHSFHATYRWEKDNCGKHYPCSIIGDFCVLAPTFAMPLENGVFRCMATENGHKVELISYRLVFNGGPLPASLASTMGPSLLLAAATLWLL